jgi:hypothetical protein
MKCRHCKSEGSTVVITKSMSSGLWPRAVQYKSLGPVGVTSQKINTLHSAMPVENSREGSCICYINHIAVIYRLQHFNWQKTQRRDRNNTLSHRVGWGLVRLRRSATRRHGVLRICNSLCTVHKLQMQFSIVLYYGDLGRMRPWYFPRIPSPYLWRHFHAKLCVSVVSPLWAQANPRKRGCTR